MALIKSYHGVFGREQFEVFSTAELSALRLIYIFLLLLKSKRKKKKLIWSTGRLFSDHAGCQCRCKILLWWLFFRCKHPATAVINMRGNCSHLLGVCRLQTETKSQSHWLEPFQKDAQRQPRPPPSSAPSCLSFIASLFVPFQSINKSLDVYTHWTLSGVFWRGSYWGEMNLSPWWDCRGIHNIDWDRTKGNVYCCNVTLERTLHSWKITLERT